MTALEQLIDSYARAIPAKWCEPEELIAAARAEQAELVAALREVLANVAPLCTRDGYIAPECDRAVTKAHALIAKHGGGK